MFPLHSGSLRCSGGGHIFECSLLHLFSKEECFISEILVTKVMEYQFRRQCSCHLPVSLVLDKILIIPGPRATFASAIN